MAAGQSHRACVQVVADTAAQGALQATQLRRGGWPVLGLAIRHTAPVPPSARVTGSLAAAANAGRTLLLLWMQSSHLRFSY
jgi:hypothetical protein